MAKMLLLYNNHVDDADVMLTGGSWSVPLSALFDPRPSRKARSSSASASATMFDLDLAAERTIRAPCLTHTNLSADARYRISWFSDAFVTETGSTGWHGIPGYPEDDPDDIGPAIFHMLGEVVTARYWRVEINDESNPAGFIEIGRTFFGDTWEPTYNFWDNSEGAEPNTTRQTSLGGVGYFNRRKPARFFRFGFERLPSEEKPVLRRIRKLCNIDRQVVVIEDPDDTANLNDICFLATLRQMPALSLLQMYDASIGFEATEVVG